MPKRSAPSRGSGLPPGTVKISAAEAQALVEGAGLWLQWAGPPPEPRTRHSPKPGEWVECTLTARQGRAGRRSQQWSTLDFARFKTKDKQWDLAAEAAAGRVSVPRAADGTSFVTVEGESESDEEADDDSDQFSPKRLRSKKVLSSPPPGGGAKAGKASAASRAKVLLARGKEVPRSTRPGAKKSPTAAAVAVATAARRRSQLADSLESARAPLDVDAAMEAAKAAVAARAAAESTGASMPPALVYKPVAQIAVGETVILLHPPSNCSRCFNRDGEGASAK